MSPRDRFWNPHRLDIDPKEVNPPVNTSEKKNVFGTLYTKRRGDPTIDREYGSPSGGGIPGRIDVVDYQDPQSVPGLVAWYNARIPLIQGVGVGNTVTTFNDFKGIQNAPLISGTPKLQLVNGSPVVRFSFSGPDRFQIAGTFPNFGSSYSYILLFSCPVSLPVQQGNVGWFDINTGVGNTGMLYLPVLGSTTHAWFNTDSIGARNPQENGGASLVCDGKFHVVSCIVDAAAGIRGFRDDIIVATSIYIPPNPNVLVNLDIGSRAGGIQPVAGDLAHLLIYNRAITDLEHANIKRSIKTGYIP